MCIGYATTAVTGYTRTQRSRKTGGRSRRITRIVAENNQAAPTFSRLDQSVRRRTKGRHQADARRTHISKSETFTPRETQRDAYVTRAAARVLHPDRELSPCFRMDRSIESNCSRMDRSIYSDCPDPAENGSFHLEPVSQPHPTPLANGTIHYFDPL